jgi:hypothetical protein
LEIRLVSRFSHGEREGVMIWLCVVIVCSIFLPILFQKVLVLVHMALILLVFSTRQTEFVEAFSVYRCGGSLSE